MASDATDGGRSARQRMHDGIVAVRREGIKASLIHASVDGVAALLTVSLALRVVAVDGVPEAVALPRVGPVATATVAGVSAGVVVLVAELGYRLRQPFVERFGDANPEIAEALRTARDALDRSPDADGPMTTRLYEETVERLQATSSLGLLDLRRVTAALLLVAVLAPASVGVAAVDLTIDPFGGEETDATGSPTTDDEYEGLQNPRQVLGETENVSAGDRTVEAAVETRGSEDGGDAATAYNRGGFAGATNGSVEGQQAGFAEQERVEDAELIREYNLRLREDDSDDDDGILQ